MSEFANWERFAERNKVDLDTQAEFSRWLYVSRQITIPESLRVETLEKYFQLFKEWKLKTKGFI